MKLNPDVEAIFEFTGHRKNNVCNGYRPAHLICDDYLTTGLHSYYKQKHNFDDKIVGTITFISPEYYPNSIWVGKKIEMYEGKRLVGYAIITKIFNEILLIK